MSELPSLLCERPSLFARKKMIPRNVILKRIFEVVISSPRGLISDRLRYAGICCGEENLVTRMTESPNPQKGVSFWAPLLPVPPLRG